MGKTKTAKTSISMEAGLYKRSKDRADQLGHRNSYSAYIESLIRKDIAEAQAQSLRDVDALTREMEQTRVDIRAPKGKAGHKPSSNQST